MDQDVLIQAADGVLEVTIHRPQARNAMTKVAAEAIAAAMDRLDAEPELRCAIVTGAEGTFCAGMDLKRFMAGEAAVVEGRGFGGLTNWTPKKPLIAAVDGYALGGGMELALACDLIVANVDAIFSMPEVKRGLFAAGGGLIQLSRMLPRPLAMEMVLTGDSITAARAYELGLVNCVTEGRAIDAARELAQRIVPNGPLALALSKEIIREASTWPNDEVAARQAPYVDKILASEDVREGALAFAQKRKPEWKGR